MRRRVLAAKGVEMQELDGHQIYRFFRAGARRVLGVRRELDRINVFPVPDGDTGTNLAATLATAIESSRPSASAERTMETIADAALAGARGNSGVIFAQFTTGFYEALSDSVTISMEQFVLAVENAYERARTAVSNPRDGTILSMIGDWARALRTGLARADSFKELLGGTLPALRTALADTPNKLAELKAAGVVDAGASGFLAFVSGAHSYVEDGEASDEALDLTDLDEGGAGPDLHDLTELRFRYCTEALVVGGNLEPESIRREVADLGDSLIVAGNRKKLRLHLHTDRPADLIERLARRGDVMQQKVDDMREQYLTAHARKYPIALVTDSGCDLPQDLLEEYQIHVVPLYVRVGDVEYLDRRTLSPERFYELADRSPTFPKSSQPSESIFLRSLRFLAEYYDSILAVHLAGRLSGTLEASRRAARTVAAQTGKRIDVVDSRNLSGSLGLIVLRAAEAIASGVSQDAILSSLEAWTERAEILVSVKTLRYMVRGGRVSPLKGFAAKVLNLKPIVSLDGEGASKLYGQAFSVEANLRKIVAMTAIRHRERPLRDYAVVHAHDPDGARALALRLEKELGFSPRYIMEISSVIALNAGRGALAVVSMQE